MWAVLHDPSSRFIAQLVVTIGLARLLARVARKLGQPTVTAEIVAGIVLGPSILGAWAPSFSAALFPPGSLEPLRIASQLGVLLFVFIIGLELEPTLLRGRARATLAIASIGIAVPFALGVGAAFPVNELVASRSPTVWLALFMGAAMAVTAFPVLARILTEHRLLRTRLGALAVACAAVEDVIAWCVLAFLIAVARTKGFDQALVTTGLALAFIAVMVLLVRPLLRRFVERRNAPVMLTNNVVAMALLGALGAAWITERIGVHLVFGAFLFGALVPKRDGFARALAEKLEDLVLVLLLPLFFVMSGLRTHFQMVSSAHDLLACATIVVVACAGKIGGTVFAARLTGQPWREAGALAILMNTRGLMELIVLNVGFDLGVLSPAIFSMMVVMVLATTALTGPVLARVYPAHDAIRDLLASEPAPEREIGHRILACISHPRVGPAMVSVASMLARADTEVLALHLTRETGDASGAPDGDAILAPALARAEEHALRTRPLSFPSLDPAHDIVCVADVRAPELVLLGGHKPLLGQTLLGGVVQAVLRHADPAVAVLVDRELPCRPASLLVPYHGAGNDRVALGLAARIQRSTGASLTVLATSEGAEREAQAAVAQGGAVASIEAMRTASAEAIVARAGDIDLVVVGIGRRWGLEVKRAGFGFGADRLIRNCTASLLIVRERLGGLARAKVEA